MKTLNTGIIVLIGLSISFLANAQNECDREKIIGKWTEVTNTSGVYQDVDSLKEIIKNSEEIIGIWSFASNGTYAFQNRIFKYGSVSGKSFTFNNSTCEIALLGKNKPRSKKKPEKNLEIIYLDDKFLIYKSDDNPKGVYFTHLLKKM